MKRTPLILCCLAVMSMASAQKPVSKPNNASESVKKDANNQYGADNISTLDLLQALEIMDIKIAKFEIPKTDKERQLGIVIDEYSKTDGMKSDTTWLGLNSYHYWERGDTTVYKDCIREITLFTKQEKKDSLVQVQIKTQYSIQTTSVKYKPERENSFYQIRNYVQGEFEYGQKMPMIAIASSWYDEKHDILRFCGKTVLSVGDKDTQELLDKSPNYYIISYIIL